MIELLILLVAVVIMLCMMYKAGLIFEPVDWSEDDSTDQS